MLIAEHHMAAGLLETLDGTQSHLIRWMPSVRGRILTHHQTDSVSSLSMSTRKSRALTASSGLTADSERMASIAAALTSVYA